MMSYHRVLAVDDNENNLYLLESLLPAHGYLVDSARNGLEALDRLTSAHYDLIVSDILMPTMDGFQFCREVKADARFNHIPFIFYTATYTSEEDREFALGLGADDFLLKPQEPEIFLKAVKQAIVGRDRNAATSAHAPGEDEEDFLRQYNQRLVHKLEQKMIQLELEKERYQTTIESIRDGIVTTDTAARITYLNPAAEAILGYDLNDAVGKLLHEACPLVEESTGLQFPDPVRFYLQEGRYQETPRPLLLKNQRCVDLVVAPIVDQEKQTRGLVFTLCDITEKRDLVRQLSHQATHDSLTGLANRYEFERSLKRLCMNPDDRNRQHALIYADLDQFKVVNDTNGHLAGDELLRQTAVRLQSVVRKQDVLARLGGDEFGILLNSCTPKQAMRVANKILKVIQTNPFSWQGNLHNLGVSIGVIAIPDDGNTLEQIMSAADTACYTAKTKGRNRLHVYRPDDVDMQQIRSEMFWLPRIHQALAENRFKLYHQPILALKDNLPLTNFSEILLRMIGSDGNLVMPDDFIPAAERYDQVHLVDRWVVGQVIPLLERSQNPVPGTCLAVNLSGQSIVRLDFLDFVVDLIKNYRIPPGSICFEITETAAIADIPNARNFMSTLKAYGCYFAIDDFGNGLFSFSHLKNLPVDHLKIDGRIVRNMLGEQVDYTIVESLHHIGHAQQLKTVAEWVENPNTLEVLREMGMDYAQGFGISMPQPFG